MAWTLFLCYWPFVRGIHRSPMDSPHKGPVTQALMFSLMSTEANCWTYSRKQWFETPWRSFDVTVIYNAWHEVSSKFRLALNISNMFSLGRRHNWKWPMRSREIWRHTQRIRINTPRLRQNSCNAADDILIFIFSYENRMVLFWFKFH